MIRINLLPAEVQVSAESQTHPAVYAVGMGAFLAVVLIPLSLKQISRRNRLNADAISLQSELERYKPILAQLEALEQAKGQLQQRKNLIQQLESERLRYPQFMEDLLKQLPSNVWLTNLTTVLLADGASMSVSLDLIALDHYAIADLVSNLENSLIFADVDLGTVTLSQNPTTGQSITFHINTTYKKSGIAPNAVKKS